MVETKPPSVCTACGTTIAPGLLSCPGCRQLLHADTLKELSERARRAKDTGDLLGALSTWRRALELLPADTRQHDVVAGKVDALSREADTHSGQDETLEKSARPSWLRGAIGLGTAGLMLWKFKFILGFVLTKGKLLLLGLTKASTLFSMMLSMGLYWSLWGWRFALGLVLSIYVHEMGHVAALRRFGIRASAPTFIPGLGALVRMKQHPANAIENARIGLAGPIWGLGAALAAYGVFLSTGWASWAGISRVGAWINLFNLLPIPPLDGGRAFRALTSRHRWMAAGVVGLMWFYTAEGLLVLLLITALLRLLSKEAPDEEDRKALVQYALLVVVLSLMCTIEVPLPHREALE